MNIFFLCLKGVFAAFKSLNKRNQSQHTYKLEEISRKHYANFFPDGT